MVTLDRSQLEFCRSTERNIRLLAPAGCGKTLALLYRCREIIERSSGHPRFLIVTFTKSAAAELKERMAGDPQFESVGDQARVTTLNAYGWQRIREQVRSPRLLTSQNDYHFAMLNQLRPVWDGKPPIEAAISGRAFRQRRHGRAGHQHQAVLRNLTFTVPPAMITSWSTSSKTSTRWICNSLACWPNGIRRR